MIGNIVRKLPPSRSVLMTSVGMIAVGVLFYFVGRASNSAIAQNNRSFLQELQAGGQTSSNGRVVAYIHDTMPITREEFGEFLIARWGTERLETLVNRRIIEVACKSRGIDVTDAQVEMQLKDDLAAMKMSRKDFVNLFLKRYNKSLFEWKEDVIRPKLMLRQYVEPTIVVTEDDLRKGFEGRYGPKVECRWIVLPDDKHAGQYWEKARESEAEFNRIATTVNIPQLCQSGGKAPPIHKHFGSRDIELAAFKMAPGDVSPLIGMPPDQAGGQKSVVILKCDRLIPQDFTKRFEDERAVLLNEIRELKIRVRIDEVIGELRKAANPRLLLVRDIRQDDLESQVVPEIRGQTVPAPASKAGG